MPQLRKLCVPLLLTFGLVGCGQQSDNRTTDTSLPDSGGTSTPAPPPSAPPGGAPGMSPSAPAPSDETVAKTATTPEIEALEAKLAKSPGDADTKQKLVTALYDHGTETMNDPNLPPRVKYRAALKDYNRVLALDPGHEKAKQGKELIESIYKQMGRPIPEL